MIFGTTQNATRYYGLSKHDKTLTNGRIIMENMERSEVKQLVDDWIGLSTLVLALNPSLVVVGSGRSEIPTPLLHLPVALKPALLGNAASIEGAAWMAQQKLGGL
ncbi:MAG: hypothetical protein R3Y62_07625 [Eubacteriales bacterium]